MPFNGSGAYSPPMPQYPAVSGTTIKASDFNAIIGDLSAALSLCLTKDGQQTPIANLGMGNNRLTSLADGVALTDGMTVRQSLTGMWAAASGTSDAISGSYAINLASLTDGMILGFRVASANTTATPTFTPNSGVIPAYPITRKGGLGLRVGEFQPNAEVLLRYNLANTRWEVYANRSMFSGAVTGNLAIDKTYGDFFANVTAASATLTIAAASSLPADWLFSGAASGGPVTLALASGTDTFYVNGTAQTAGASFTINQGGHWFATADSASGKVYLFVRHTATSAQALAGTDTQTSMSPKATSDLINQQVYSITGGQIALINMRLMLNSSVASGALAQGYQWELNSDEWATGSSGYLYVNSTPSYYTNGGTSTQYTPTGSPFSFGVISYGTNAVPFDGVTTSRPGANALLFNPGENWAVGKSFSSAVNITSVAVIAPSAGYANGMGAVSLTFRIYGKATAPTGPTDGTLMGSLTFTQSGGYETKTITTSGSYQYVWLQQNGGSGQIGPSQILYYTTTPNQNMLLLSPAVPVASAPSTVDGYFLYKDDSGSAVAGTDYTAELSRDGGTTFTNATLSVIASYDGTYNLIKARADVSGQPSGTSLKMRVKTFNIKPQRIAAPAIYKE